VGQPNEDTDNFQTNHVTTPNGYHPTSESETNAQPVHAKNSTGYSGHVTPVVARMVEQHDIDLSQIEGSGRNGRIRKKDVLAYLEGQPSTEAEQELAPWEIPASGNLFKPTVNYEDEIETPAQPKQTPPQPKPAPVASDVAGELVALSGMRRSIAHHMVESKLHTAPHVTTVMEVDLQNVTKHREANKDDFAKRGVKLTFTPYFVAACAKALQDIPELNARWTDEGLFMNHVQHIGMAVAIDDGLIVPVIKNAQDYNLVGLARQVNDLAERARNRKLQPDEISGGTFTITNHGVSGSLLATPIINQPQSAILGVGMIEKRVKVMDDALAIRPCAYLSLTFDHRVVDGATADAFLMHVKQILEYWA
jgi:2-oxoglutarate dehydrogenase E2 component (dihydrolipoamide succinyltransferase)